MFIFTSTQKFNKKCSLYKSPNKNNKKENDDVEKNTRCILFEVGIYMQHGSIFYFYEKKNPN